ncbi:MAG: FGGY family carbohydrate kinase, partial [Candidatus Thermoplasmatota archaeon]|nr:FGGY family carbohydrate kinase [Candidatus Thermoplasmatota archaeon]
MQEKSSGYILSIDSGTSGCKSSLWNEDGLMVKIRTETLDRIFPRENFVEQDPNMIWERQTAAIKSVISQ